MMFLVAVVLALSPPQDALRDARAHVASGELDAAIARLEPHANAGDPAVINYLAAVRAARVPDDQLRELYRKAGSKALERHVEGARAAIASAGGDLHLELRVAVVPEEARQLEQTVAAAHKAWEAKDWALADAMYARAQASPLANESLAQDLATRRALIAERRDRGGFVSSFVGALAALPSAAGSLAVPLLLVLVLLVVPLAWQRRRMKRARTVSFQLVDRRGSAGSEHSPALAGRFFATLRGALHVDPRPDLTGRRESLGDLIGPADDSVMEKVRTFAKEIDEGQKVEIGPLKVPLRSLFSMVLDALFPARFAYVGELIHRGGNATHFSLTRWDRAHRESKTWVASADGVDATGEEVAMSRVVYQLITDEVKQGLPSRSPRALRAYHEAVRSLELLDEAVERDQTLAQVRARLQEAVAADPSFHDAQLRLGIVLRKLGDLAGAETAFAKLRGARTELQPYIDYHEARVYLDYADLPRLMKAKARLERLLDERKGKRDALWCYTNSARVAVIAKMLGSPRVAAALGPARRQQFAEELAKTMAIFLPGAAGKLDDEPAFVVARGLARYARGRQLLADKKYAAALDDFVDAAQDLPHYASVKVALARVYRERREPQWFESAMSKLDEAIAIDPNDPAVNEEYAQLTLQSDSTRVDDALARLRVASRHRGSARFLEGKLLAQRPADLDAGIAAMWDAWQRAREGAPVEYIEELIHVLRAQAEDAQRARVKVVERARDELAGRIQAYAAELGSLRKDPSRAEEVALVENDLASLKALHQSLGGYADELRAPAIGSTPAPARTETN